MSTARPVRRPLGHPWPFTWRDLGVLVAWTAATIAVYVAIGEAITRWSAVDDADRDAARWFEDQRTDTLSSVAPWAAGLSDTIVKIIATTLIVIVLLNVWKRWLEPLVVAGALIVEATAFITITTIVGRPRPEVEQLQESPVNSSFPSGHVAAAAAYLAIAVVLGWHVRRRWVRALAWTTVAAITVTVAIARLYEGMHYVSDVIFGVLLGIWSVAVVVHVLRRAHTDALDEPVGVPDDETGHGADPAERHPDRHDHDLEADHDDTPPREWPVVSAVERVGTATA